MKKIVCILFLFSLMTVLSSCIKKNAVLTTPKEYEITSNISSLNIEINAADFKIEVSDKFRVVSNLKYLTVTEKDGTLNIIDKIKQSVNYTNAILELYIPREFIFEKIDISTGAAKLTSCALFANKFDLELGAGLIEIDSINAYQSIEIDGGTGAVNIKNGVLNNLSLEMGVGSLNLTASMLGDSELEFGIGTSNITLIGNKDLYCLKIEKGIGNITVDNELALNSEKIGTGTNTIKIEGGIGNIDVSFKEEK